MWKGAMAAKTVVIFGAGATKACGGPLTNEILPQAFEPAVRIKIERENYLDLLERFLVDAFHLPQQQSDRSDSDYPALPLLISLIDKAIDLSQPMGPDWSTDQLRQVRRSLQYAIFALLEYKLRAFSPNYYADLFRELDPHCREPPVVISLNYDIIADNAMVDYSNRFPDYGCYIATDRYKTRPHFGTLLKIHGSLNWSYCPGCDRLDLGVSESDRTYKMLDELYQVNPLEPRYSCHGFACPQCGTFVEPVLITPTQTKDYRNPHVRQVWMLAEQELRQADRAIIVGYSLPDDDLDVIYLLKRGLGQLANRAPEKITVVEKASDEATRLLGKNPIGRRYRSIFGPRIDWQSDGFEGLISRLRRDSPASGGSPLSQVNSP
jgi:hypothetical protein